MQVNVTWKKTVLVELGDEDLQIIRHGINHITEVLEEGERLRELLKGIEDAVEESRRNR